MKSYSNIPVVEQPLERLNYIANHDGFPRNSVPPSIFYHNTLERLFINVAKPNSEVEDWQIIPYNSFREWIGIKSSTNIGLLDGKKIPYTKGGTYLIDSDGKKDQKYALPASTLVNGIVYNLKNIGKNYIIMVTENEDTIEHKDSLVIHPNQCTTIQAFNDNWVILNTYHPESL